MVRNCNACKRQVFQRNLHVRTYLKQRALILRYGCLCSTNYIYWPVPAIATALGMSKGYVSNVVIKWRKEKRPTVCDKRTLI